MCQCGVLYSFPVRQYNRVDHPRGPEMEVYDMPGSQLAAGVGSTGLRAKP